MKFNYIATLFLTIPLDAAFPISNQQQVGRRQLKTSLNDLVQDASLVATSGINYEPEDTQASKP
ncbi:hypothetical protein DSO57_1015860 [Entomophthora muscae]|uniref:Uncharacterized protein n=1 Tax=Entomophthora muscae TaxID=34485 RepID=A0ACC2UR46_9FUNG|nr:hypothetical protein DSO57_1015860 [Entomophthora muscae]